MLNDSDDSELGEGVFLDTAINLGGQPVYTPSSNVPVDDLVIQSRIGDQLYQKRFGVVLIGLNRVEPNREYQIVWSTPPGEATVDNVSATYDKVPKSAKQKVL